MADGANEATEVIRFTQELEFDNAMARIIFFDDLKTLIFRVESWNSKFNFGSLQT